MLNYYIAIYQSKLCHAMLYYIIAYPLPVSACARAPPRSGRDAAGAVCVCIITIIICTYIYIYIYIYIYMYSRMTLKGFPQHML